MYFPIIIIVVVVVVTLIVPVNSVSHTGKVFMFHNTLGKKSLFCVIMQSVV